MTPVDLLTALVLLFGIWSVACRIRLMHPDETEPLEFARHFALGMAFGAALILPPPLAKLALAGGMAFYLVASAHRWRYAQPDYAAKESADAVLAFPPQPASTEPLRPARGGGQ